MEELNSILEEWAHDYTWVFGEKDLISKGHFMCSNMRTLEVEVTMNLSDSSFFVDDTPLPFERQLKVTLKMVEKEKVEKSELDKLRNALKDFDCKCIKEREQELSALIAQGKQLKTNNPFLVYKDKE